MIENLTSTSDVIDKLGGTRAVANLFGCGVNAVSNWRVSNRFPADTYEALTAELTRHGHAASASLWGFRKSKRSAPSSEPEAVSITEVTQ